MKAAAHALVYSSHVPRGRSCTYQRRDAIKGRSAEYQLAGAIVETSWTRVFPWRISCVGKRFLYRVLSEWVGGREGAMSGPSAFILMASPSCLWWGGSWTGRYQGNLAVGHLRAVHQHTSYGIRSNKFVNVWACMHYKKYPSGIMIAPSIHNSFMIFSHSMYTPIH